MAHPSLFEGCVGGGVGSIDVFKGYFLMPV